MERRRRFDGLMQLLQQFVEPLSLADSPYVGIAAGVIAGNDIQIGIFGKLGDPERELSSDSIFELASLIKTFTGLLLCDD